MATQYRVVEIQTPRVSDQSTYPLYQLESATDGLIWQYEGATLSDRDSAFNRVRQYQREQGQSTWETVMVRRITEGYHD